jgi:hypothetical protein
MKRTLTTVALLLLFGAAAAAASSRGLRCGGDLVSPGYLKFEVLQSCGKPISKEIVGEAEFSDADRLYDRRYSRFPDRDRRVVLYIEEWLYEKDGLYVLRFEGNWLVAVESVRRK